MQSDSKNGKVKSKTQESKLHFISCKNSKMTICRGVVTTFFEYNTPQLVRIRSKKIGLLHRTVELCIISYIVGYVIVYKKGYQEFSDIYSSVTTKLKGTVRPNFTDDELDLPYPNIYRKVWDVADYVIPPQEKSAFFVTTNILITPNQTQGACAEDPDFKHVRCKPYFSARYICIRGHAVRNGNGIMTGRCVLSFDKKAYVCEVEGWCPTEINALPFRGQRALLGDSQEFTVLIKNSIEFPLFKIRRRNIKYSSNSSYLGNCQYDKQRDQYCPIFKLETIVEEAGENYSKMAIKGGVVAIIINWDCNLDFDAEKHCFPKYEFRRIDDPQAKISQGWNFRYAHYHSENQRTLYKAYGIRFVIVVHGRGGRFSFVPFLLNVGSGLALLGASTLICDIIVLHITKKKLYYKEKKYTEV